MQHISGMFVCVVSISTRCSLFASAADMYVYLPVFTVPGIKCVVMCTTEIKMQHIVL